MLLTCAGVPVFAAGKSRVNVTSPYGLEVARTKKNLTEDGLTIRTLGRVNTVDFEGTFSHGFPWDYTREDTFHGAQSDETVTFLHNQTFSCPYGADGNFQALGLPYSETDYELYLLLPNDETQDPAKLWNRYSKAQKKEFLDNVTSHAMTSVNIPRLKLDVTTNTQGYRQTVRLNVDEQGTHPDPVRMPIQRPTCVIPPRDRIIFNANRPFYLLLLNTKTEKVIYAGSVYQL